MATQTTLVRRTDLLNMRIGDHLYVDGERHRLVRCIWRVITEAADLRDWPEAAIGDWLVEYELRPHATPEP